MNKRYWDALERGCELCSADGWVCSARGFQFFYVAQLLTHPINEQHAISMYPWADVLRNASVNLVGAQVIQQC